VSHTYLKRLALVAYIFLGHALYDRFHALEAASRIEERALLAGVQFESAFGTLPFARACRTLQNGTALSAAGDCSGSWQIHRLGAECVVPTRRTTGAFRRRLLLRLLSTGFPITVLVSVLTVFRHNPPQVPGSILN
jgi:hypothetical protein